MEIVDLSDHRRIRLVGRLTAAQVHELIEASRGRKRAVHLDLSELMSVDAIGLDVLHGLQLLGVQLLEVPPYIQLKLDSLSSRRDKPRG